MKLDLDRDTIFVTLAGSQAHGTAQEGSDVDLRGVCVAPLALRVSLFDRFEQYEGELTKGLWEAVLPRLEQHQTAKHGLAVKTETVLFDIAKFMGLCVEANPNALEILFADEGDWVHETPAWRRLYQQRHRLLSKKVKQTYVGYAMAQLKKIKAHRAWLLAPPPHKPAREEFGLPVAPVIARDDEERLESALADRLRSYGIDAIEMPRDVRIAVQERLRAIWCDLVSTKDDGVDEGVRHLATKALQLPQEVTRALEAERRYRAAMRQWEAYETWRKQRNPKRAALEREHGYDTKHAMHLIRLMRTGLEVLETGDLRVRRGDAQDLRDIRKGALTFEELVVAAKELEVRIERAMEASPLAAKPDEAFAEEITLELIRQGR